MLIRSVCKYFNSQLIVCFEFVSLFLFIQINWPTEEDSISAAASICAENFPVKQKDDPWYLHLGFVLPGILYPEKAPAQVDFESAKQTFMTNALGPLLMLKHFEQFLPRKRAEQYIEQENLSRHAVWAMMSARVGSISDNKLGGWYSYRSSKAALNQVAKSFDIYLKMASAENAMAISMHPGTVKTGLSKEFWNNVRDEKLFTPEFAAERLLDVIKSSDGNIDAYRGRCWDWEGKEIPP